MLFISSKSVVYHSGTQDKDLSIFIKYYLDKDSDYQLSIDKIFLIKVQALAWACWGYSSAFSKIWVGRGRRAQCSLAAIGRAGGTMT